MDRRGNRRRDWHVPPCYQAIAVAAKRRGYADETRLRLSGRHVEYIAAPCKTMFFPPMLFWDWFAIEKNLRLCSVLSVLTGLWECCSSENEKIDESGEGNFYFILFYLCAFVTKLTCTLLLMLRLSPKTGRQTEGQTDRQTVCYVFRQRQADRQTDRQRKNERQRKK